MIQKAIELSLIITAIYVCTWDGMIFEKPRIFIQNLLDCMGLGFSLWVQKPLFGCLMCMSSFWTIALTIWDTPYNVVFRLIFLVCGINTIINSIIKNLRYYEE